MRTIRLIIASVLLLFALGPILLAGMLVEARMPFPLFESPPTAPGPAAPDRRQRPAPAPPVQAGNPAGNVRLYDQKSDRLFELPLEQYLAGVVPAEMPVSFPMEAIKAQAIVARTYTLYRLMYGEGCSSKPEADFCSTPETGQAWMSNAALRDRWGLLNYYRNIRRVRDALEETAGTVVSFEGRPIEALYHAASGGMTEAAEDVWGRPVPYLVSVPSPERSRYDRVESRFNAADLAARLGLPERQVLSTFAAGRELLKPIKTSSSGRVLEIDAAGRRLTGNELREKLGLPSTRLQVRQEKSSVVIMTQGYGHGVGLSQYGAALMAEQGANAAEILAHYYPGTRLKMYESPRAGNNRP